MGRERLDLLFPDTALDIQKTFCKEIIYLFIGDGLVCNLRYLKSWMLLSKAWKEFLEETLLLRSKHQLFELVDRAISDYKRIPTKFFRDFIKKWDSNQQQLVTLWSFGYIELDYLFGRLSLLGKNNKTEIPSKVMVLFKEIASKTTIDSPRKCTELYELISGFIQDGLVFHQHRQSWIFSMEKLLESSKDDQLLEHLIDYAKLNKSVIRGLKAVPIWTMRHSPSLLCWAFRSGLTKHQISQPYFRLIGENAFKQKVNGKKNNLDKTQQDGPKFTKESSAPCAEIVEKYAIESEMNEFLRIDNLAQTADLNLIQSTTVSLMDPLSIAKNNTTDVIVLRNILTFHPQMNLKYREYFETMLKEKSNDFRKELLSLWFKETKKSSIETTSDLLDPLDFIDENDEFDFDQEEGNNSD